MIVCTTEITLYDQNETPQGSLSSESHSVPCDPDGSNPDLTGASSTLQVILGDEDITDEYSLICTPSSGVTGTKNGYTYTVTGMTAIAGFVDFVATKAGAATIQKRFSIVKQPKGNTGDPGAPGVDAPRCRGLYPYGTAPSSPVAGDLVVWYSTTTEDCGIYQYANNTWSKLTAPTPDQVGRCFIHILSAVVAAVRTDSAGNTISVAYGVSADYAPNSVAFEILLARFIFAQDITATGSITGLFIRSTDKRISISDDGDGANESDGINVGTHDLTGAPTGQKIQIARGYSLFGSEIQVLRFLQAVGGAWRERLQQYISVAGYPVIRDPYSGLSIMFEYPNKLKIYKTGTDANSGTSAIVEIDGLSARGAITAGDYIDAPLLKTNRLETFLGDELTTNYGFDLAKIDDDSTPVASKSSGSLDSGQRSGLFTVYKSITVYMQSTNIVLDLYYNGSYIEILRPGKATPLNPGRYSFRNESDSDSQSGILRCLGVYGSVDGGHIWS